MNQEYFAAWQFLLIQKDEKYNEENVVNSSI